VRVGDTVNLAAHLAHREAASAQRLTLLGWAWPLVRQLAQLGILVLVFSHFLGVDIPNFALFVFCGLLVWNWFSASVPMASTSVVTKRHLALQPGFPSAIIPAVSVVVPLIDVLMVVPILGGLLAFEGELRWSAVALPLVFAVEMMMLVGLAWLVAAASVYLRDIPNALPVLMMLLFYVSPIFYDRQIVPDDYEWVLDVNPIAILIEATRALLLDLPGPSAGQIAWVTAFAIAVFGLGFLTFQRLQRGFADEL